ncbi:hypothetical protein TL16_g05733 [Triparma laevis f. inornata]|uniref:Enoyl-CoA hydratase n=1 Tax=Triparma laevis f. inornata TaxID=1714386 RepID=A0A9W7EAE0_9STRA|nr:hypothetical protein TL16_g05733 [Triparma laevis f. inornata]
MQRSAAIFHGLTKAIPPKGSVFLTRTPRIATIELNSPTSRNALTPSMMLSLHTIVEDLQTNPPPFLMLTGANGTFCSGADIGVAASTLMTLEGGEAMSNLMNQVMNNLKDLPSVSFAAIDGAAYGGGAELATCCDFRVLAPAAKLRFVQAGMGVTCGWGGARRLSNIIGEKEALKLMLFRTIVTPSLGIQNGLVDYVSEADSPTAADFTRSTLIEGLQDLDAGIITSLKPSVQAEKIEDEISVFVKHWGGEPHVAAFQRAMEKSKQFKE